jgi:hypothetical protein
VSRVIRPEAASRTRERLLEGASLALQGLDAASPGGDDQLDRLAFAHLCLSEARRSAEETVEAWEKRGYWVKADRFRAEWDWLGPAEAGLTEALAAGDIDTAVSRAKSFRDRLPQARPGRNRMGPSPWEGAWRRWSDR